MGMFANTIGVNDSFCTFAAFAFEPYCTIQKRKWLWNCLALCGSNKMLSLSLKWHCLSSVPVVFTSAVPMVFGSAVTLVTFVLVVLFPRFNSWDHFFNFFQKCPKFRFRN